jgi:DNA repair exonuclease SbcCD nuclease subunit
MKILHIADIHLDRTFAAGHGSRRRGELRDALVRALELGADRGVDAICIAGDVYEHETVSEDTAAFLRDRLGRSGVPVLIAPGNHDPYLAGSVWERGPWPENVRIFRHDRIEAAELSQTTVVWGAAFTARHCSTSAVAGWTAPADSRAHLLLLHAALTGEQWADEPAHRPVTRRQLSECGVRYAMLGHFHDGRADDLLCYPGSPEPLGWGERAGRHAAAILTVSPDGCACELVEIARRRYAEETIRVDGAASSDEIERRVEAAAAAHAGAALLVTLEGEVDPACEVDGQTIEARCAEGLDQLRVRDRTHPAYDLEQLAGERSVRGRFVARLAASGDPLAREAVLAGLRALDGRREVIADPAGGAP